MSKSKFLLLFSFALLFLSLFFGVQNVEASYTECCSYTSGGILKKCEYFNPCTKKSVCIQSETAIGAGGAPYENCLKYEERYECNDTQACPTISYCKQESYTYTGQSTCSGPRESVVGQKVQCLSNDLCKKSFAKEIKIEWKDTAPETVIGETAKLSTTIIVKDAGGNLISPILLSCTNCDKDYTKVTGYGETINFEVNTGKLFDKTLKKEDSLVVSAKLNGFEISSHTVVFKSTQFDCSQYKPPCSENEAKCFPMEGKCYSRVDRSICSQIKQPELCGTQANGGVLGSKACFWNSTLALCQTGLEKGITDQYKVPDNYVENGGVLPPCAFSGTCRNINDFLELLIKFGKATFGIIGMYAFVFFVYGGFTMITSFGSAEKVKKGRDMLLAAVVGIIIAFSAYLLINFILSALGVSGDFRVIN